MSMRYLGFVLLVLFPGVLYAQSAAQLCPAPRLVGGYFIPVQENDSHEKELIYACNNGRKPAVEGWWATSTCQNGKWSHEPQCIDEKACFPPTIPNAK
ncbi:coagulation factor XIII B chain-like, partial [Lates japonicus]